MAETRTPRTHWIELGAAVVLAAATVLTAWCVYQSARWNGVQAVLFGEANAARVEAVRQSNLGAQLVAIDVGMWLQYVSALSEGNQQLADFVASRFRPDLKAANDAWLATNPLGNPIAPTSPFAMSEYRPEALQEAERLNNVAEEKVEAGKEAIRRSNNYVLLTVIVASVLFFGGISSKFESGRLRQVSLAIAAVALIAVVLVLTTYPVY